jgi:predicted nucleotidyltransferase
MGELQHTAILDTLRLEFARVLGEQLESMLLFGSRARGDSRPDSDIDVLVVVRDPVDYGELIRRTSEVVSTLSQDNDVVISRAFVSKERFEREQSPFLRNVRREGIVNLGTMV